MMYLNSTAFIIPIGLVCIGLEYYYVSKHKNKKIFNYDNSVANISIGIAERLCELLLAASFYDVFNKVHQNFSIYDLPNKWYTWILLLLLTDLVWYWYHRLGHEMNIFWGAHIVHHQSEDYNYTVASRITIIQSLVRNVFWCILPIVGFNADMVVSILIIHGGYSFFTHTQAIGRLGFLERILVTPSHHRVHHASNEKYLDKNYGDIFIFWDKLFGTFQEEEEEKPKYGLTQPLNSYSFLWQHFHFYIELINAINNTKGWKAKARLLFGGPNLINPAIRPALEQKFLKNQSRISTKYRFRNYLSLQITICILSLFLLTLFYQYINAAEKTGIMGFILLTLINCGAMLEKRKWIHYLEAMRIEWLIIYTGYFTNSLNLVIFLTVTFLVTILIFPIKKWYHQAMFYTS